MLVIVSIISGEHDTLGSRLSFTNDKVYVPDPFCGDLQLTRVTRKFVQQVDRSLLKRVAHINHLLFNKLKHSYVNLEGRGLKGLLCVRNGPCPALLGFNQKYRLPFRRLPPAFVYIQGTRILHIKGSKVSLFVCKKAVKKPNENRCMCIKKKKIRVPNKRLDHITIFACLWV